jgi:urease accessory protein
MLLVQTVVGNENDPQWQTKLADAEIDVLALDQWEAQKNRMRKHTQGGAELALSLDRQIHLRSGDILFWDESSKKAIVARVALQDVLVIDFGQLLQQTPEVLAQTCIELGHALGNQHWPAVVKEGKVYVPLTVDKKVMSSVMKTHAFSGLTYGFQPGTEVIRYLAPHESRRLFGGANSTPHSHLATLG